MKLSRNRATSAAEPCAPPHGAARFRQYVLFQSHVAACGSPAPDSGAACSVWQRTVSSSLNPPRPSPHFSHLSAAACGSPASTALDLLFSSGSVFTHSPAGKAASSLWLQDSRCASRRKVCEMRARNCGGGSGKVAGTAVELVQCKTCSRTAELARLTGYFAQAIQAALNEMVLSGKLRTRESLLKCLASDLPRLLREL